MNKNEFMKKNKYFPMTGNYLKEGMRLALLNATILAIVIGVGLGLFWIINLARKANFLIPLPVWLFTFGIGIPCFIIWFQYGKAFGQLSSDRQIIRGATVALLGDIPGFGCLYIFIEMRFDFLISLEVQKIILILLMMIVIMMPIMTFLGTLDAKKAGAKR